MLSASETIGLREILNDLDNEVLISLLETVTKRMFTTRHRQEAIEKILSCTENPLELLRRQKITKKILFKYLIKKGQVVLADWAKSALAKKCLEVWGSNESCMESDFVDDENGRESQTTTEVTAVTSEMGIQFSKWFFQILNTLDGFGPEHFWANCNLSAELYTPSDQKEVSVCGDTDVATFLANLVMFDKFCFCANNSGDSILTELEPHGLVKVLVRGVLHQHSNCVGLFDSAFGLVKNPDCQDTYKIQVIKVKMQVNVVTPGMLPVNSNYLSISQKA